MLFSNYFFGYFCSIYQSQSTLRLSVVLVTCLLLIVFACDASKRKQKHHGSHGDDLCMWTCNECKKLQQTQSFEFNYNQCQQECITNHMPIESTVRDCIAAMPPERNQGDLSKKEGKTNTTKTKL